MQEGLGVSHVHVSSVTSLQLIKLDFSILNTQHLLVFKPLF